MVLICCVCVCLSMESVVYSTVVSANRVLYSSTLLYDLDLHTHIYITNFTDRVSEWVSLRTYIE
jgi:hypothetical protein